MPDNDLYHKLWQMLLTDTQLRTYGYPIYDWSNPGRPTLDNLGPIRTYTKSSFVCHRCKSPYTVNQDGYPIMGGGICVFHNKKYFPNTGYDCCNGSIRSAGCGSSLYHVREGSDEPELRTGFVKTKPTLYVRDLQVYALDCEMSYTTIGLEVTRITVIDQNYETKYERLIKPPRPILDYNTKYSGISESDLCNVKTNLDDVHADLLHLFTDNTILIGHSMDHDFFALKLIHDKVIDTSQLYPHKRGLPYKRALKNLAKDHLGLVMRQTDGHDSKEDAIACMRLVMHKVRS